MNELEFNKINAEKLTTINGIDNTIAVNNLDNFIRTDYKKILEDKYTCSFHTNLLMKWSEPKYPCPECGAGMCRNETIVLTSYPP